MVEIAYIKNPHRRMVWARGGTNCLPRFLASLLVIAAFPLFSLFAEIFNDWPQNWTLISPAQAYKVKRVCENVISKKGTTEKCATKLVKDGEDNAGAGKSGESKGPHAAKKDTHAAPSGGH